jgi:hypothetical protein
MNWLPGETKENHEKAQVRIAGLRAESMSFNVLFLSFFLFLSCFKCLVSFFFCSQHSWKYAHIHSSFSKCTYGTT